MQSHTNTHATLKEIIGKNLKKGAAKKFNSNTFVQIAGTKSRFNGWPLNVCHKNSSSTTTVIRITTATMTLSTSPPSSSL